MRQLSDSVHVMHNKSRQNHIGCALEENRLVIVAAAHVNRFYSEKISKIYTHRIKCFDRDCASAFGGPVLASSRRA